jgi:hypothetical protein
MQNCGHDELIGFLYLLMWLGKGSLNGISSNQFEFESYLEELRY